ncbi:MAG: ABC transporter substrate-binding protein [Treponema sp.]|jgi:ABC-type nitrate/sulfonate/bicarbonate transport system substrate-binding protein|nr:ABC transporter substrate-binding protein [Treponema sp.]
MKRREFKAVLAAVLLAALPSVFLVTACEGKKATAPGDSQGLEKLPVLKISARDWNYVANSKGWFKPFTDNGTKIELIQGVLGNEVQLFARGEVHFTQRMLYPYMLFRIQGADLIAIQASTHPVVGVTSIMVKTESPYQTLDDLRGKKIASWRASCPYMVLFELTERKGWQEGTDWIYVNTREYREALIAGEAEAISWHPSDNVAALLTTGTAREIAYPDEESVYINGGGITVQFTASEFADKYPNIVRKYVEIMDSSYEWILNNTDEAAAIIETITRAPPEVTKLTWERQIGNWRSERDLATIIRETDVMQEWLIEHGDIAPDKKADAASLFDVRFFN